MNTLKKHVTHGGYQQLLLLAIPIILNTGLFALQHIINRIFLTWYSEEAVAAVMPAGILQFSILALFFGTSGYVSTFIAQYHGAVQKHMMVKILWQGLFVALFGAFFFLFLIPLAVPFFSFIGHAKLVQQNEVIYFQILCAAAFFPIASNALVGYFSGTGNTWPSFYVAIGSTLINVICDYLLIFGNFGFPELGIKGAGISIVCSTAFSFFCYLFLILREKQVGLFHKPNFFHFEWPLFKRLLKFGFPQGLQMFLDLFGITIFVLLIGRLGTDYLAATNIAFNLNMLIFMPLTGLSIAVSILVGQNIGANKSQLAEKSTYNGLKISLLYVLIISFICFFFPEILLYIFGIQANQHFANVQHISSLLLKFVAAYSFFDAIFIIFSAALRGAGDTIFVMKIVGLYSIIFLMLPVYILLEIFHGSIFIAWGILVFYVFMLGATIWLRFEKKIWKNMTVL
ncbi:MAG: MATE family efflux transporter [Candidatus Margulisiibacteriota bacterium]|jgi:MATE family multidrug resistance protein